MDAARELLQFGLQGTDLSAAVMISQGKLILIIIYTETLQSFLLLKLGKDQGRFNLLTPDDLDISQEEYMLLVDPDNLEVKRLLSFRKQFLFYLDMLETYEVCQFSYPNTLYILSKQMTYFYTWLFFSIIS